MNELFDLQAEQQMVDFGINPKLLTDSQRTELTDELLLSLYEELGELARAIRVKPHVVQERPSRGNTLDGLVDVLKTTLALAHAHDIPYPALVGAFQAKTFAVADKRRQFLTKMANDVTVFVTDLDGCVSDLHRFIREVQGGVYGAQAGTIEIERRKADWYEAGGFLDSAVIEGARDALHAIRARGHRIAILTARPTWVHRRVAWDTQQWLKVNDIPYDILAFGKDKFDELVRHVLPARVIGFVEDRDKHAMELAAQQVPVLLMDTEWNQNVPNSDHIKRVFNWSHVLSELKSRGHL